MTVVFDCPRCRVRISRGTFANTPCFSCGWQPSAKAPFFLRPLRRAIGAIWRAWPFAWKSSARRSVRKFNAGQQRKTRRLRDAIKDMQRRHEASVEQTLRGLTSDADRRNAELAELKKQIDPFLDRLVASDVFWPSPSSPYYGIQTRIDPRMIGYGNMQPESLALIAKMCGERVERTIRAAKFVDDPDRDMGGIRPRIARWTGGES